MPAFVTLKVRSEFLSVRGGARASTPGFLIESRKRPEKSVSGVAPASRKSPDQAIARFGFTVTKKLGGAVRRNKIRRRLKAAVAEIAVDHADAGCDYVIVARNPAFDRAYTDLVADLKRALASLHRRGPKMPGPKPQTGRSPVEKGKA